MGLGPRSGSAHSPEPADTTQTYYDHYSDDKSEDIMPVAQAVSRTGRSLARVCPNAEGRIGLNKEVKPEDTNSPVGV